MDRNEMPVGFTMALAQNPDAMQKFALLPEAEKQKLIEGTHAVHSRDEMRAYVEKLVEKG